MKDLFVDKKCIFRTYSAGVHYGTLVERDGDEVLVIDAIRIWYWKGACSLSQLAIEGVKNPKECKFSVTVPEIILTKAIEIIPCTAKASKIIEGVDRWQS